MKEAEIYLDDKKILTVKIADNFWLRFKGLMWKQAEKIKDMGGLWIIPCSQIHTFSMKASIDVLYLDSEGTILKAQKSVKPYKCFAKVKKGKSVVELPEGTIEKLRLKEDMVLEVRK